MVGMIVDLEAAIKVVIPKALSGVALLWNEGVPIYVSEGPHIVHRVSRHLSNRRRGRKGLAPQKHSYIGPDQHRHIEFDEVWFWLVPEENLVQAAEELIQHFKPRLNKMPGPVQARALEAVRNLPGFKRLAEITPVPYPSQRKLPPEVQRVESSFRTHRDPRVKVTLPEVKCLQDGE